jgi:hypothetical protein
MSAMLKNTYRYYKSYRLLEHPVNTMPTRVAISRQITLEIMTALGLSITQDVPEVFKGIIRRRLFEEQVETTAILGGSAWS